jgi:protein gp37
MGKTNIEWCTDTWNPIRARNKETGKVGWFCEHMSAGCDNCYAATMNRNTYFGNGLDYKASSLPQLELFLDDKMLATPLHWRTPKKIFVCSMTDLFGRFVPDEWIDKIFAIMALAPQHTFQILTKRPDRMRNYLSASVEEGRRVVVGNSVTWTHNASWPLPNVWLGTSAEDKDTYQKRVVYLSQTPAAVRFISFEPLIGSVGDLMLDGIFQGAFHWAIFGGESGKLARLCRVDYVRSGKEQCEAAGVAPFVKQLGARPVVSDLTHWNCPTTLLPDGSGYELKLKSKKGGDPSEWPEDLRVRSFPESRESQRG